MTKQIDQEPLPPGPPEPPSTMVGSDRIEFIETTPPIYAIALDRRAAYLQGLSHNMTVVIYRLSHIGSHFFVSRQVDPCSGGDELRTATPDEEREAMKLGYDLFRVPKKLVVPPSGDENELTQAVIRVCDLGQQPPPTDGGPNVATPS